MKHLDNPYIEGLGNNPVSTVCIPVAYINAATGNLYVGNSSAAVQIVASGSAPITYKRNSGSFPSGMTLNTDTGLISGTPTTAGSYSYQMEVSNACGTDTKDLTTEILADATAFTLRYGNFTFGSYGTAAPTFSAGTFLGLDSRYAQVAKSTPSSINGNYVFPAAAGVRQVLWIAASLLPGGSTSKNFTVGGFPLSLDPANNTPVQSLTINGVPGYVFFTAYQNTGGITVNIA